MAISANQDTWVDRRRLEGFLLSTVFLAPAFDNGDLWHPLSGRPLPTLIDLIVLNGRTLPKC